MKGITEAMRDRRAQSMRERIDALEKENRRLQKEKQELLQRVNDYERIIADVKDSEKKYNEAMQEASSIREQYQDAMDDLIALRDKFRTDAQEMINGLKKVSQ